MADSTYGDSPPWVCHSSETEGWWNNRAARDEQTQPLDLSMEGSRRGVSGERVSSSTISETLGQAMSQTDFWALGNTRPVSPGLIALWNVNPKLLLQYLKFLGDNISPEFVEVWKTNSVSPPQSENFSPVSNATRGTSPVSSLFQGQNYYPVLKKTGAELLAQRKTSSPVLDALGETYSASQAKILAPQSNNIVFPFSETTCNLQSTLKMMDRSSTLRKLQNRPLPMSHYENLLTNYQFFGQKYLYESYFQMGMMLTYPGISNQVSMPSVSPSELKKILGSNAELNAPDFNNLSRDTVYALISRLYNYGFDRFFETDEHYLHFQRAETARINGKRPLCCRRTGTNDSSYTEVGESSENSESSRKDKQGRLRDPHYWNHRRRNNLASRRSKQAKRARYAQKEIQRKVRQDADVKSVHVPAVVRSRHERCCTDQCCCSIRKFLERIWLMFHVCSYRSPAAK